MSVVVLESLFGQPDEKLSSGEFLRFGMLSYNVTTNKIFDYANDAEIALVALVMREKQFDVDQALEWIKAHIKFEGGVQSVERLPDETSIPEWLQAEHDLLLILGWKPELTDHVIDDVGASDFVHPIHARLFLLFEDLLVNDRELTAAAITETIAMDPKSELFGGFTVGQYIAHILAAGMDQWLGAPREELIEVARTLAKQIRVQADIDNGAEPEVAPKPYVPKFGAVHWSEMHIRRSTTYRYWIEDLIPANESVLIYGESQSGKSYIAAHMAMCIARGVPFFDRRVTQGLIVYCAVEAGQGFFQLRMPGYERYHNIPEGEKIPFVCFPKKFDLFGSDTDIVDLISDIEHVKKMYAVPFAGTVIDTYNKATPGLDEISGKDVGKVVHRLDMVRTQTQGGVWLVHHKNASGMPRGHTSLYAGFETAIEVSRDPSNKDFNGREIRNARNSKQREGVDGSEWPFVIRGGVDIGIVNEYGRPVTAAVVEEPQTTDQPVARRKPGAGGYAINSQKTRAIFRCLLEALRSHGEKPPAGVKVPAGIGLVVHRDRWRDVLMSRVEVGETDQTKRAENVKKAIQRAIEKFPEAGIAGVDYPWVWRTEKDVEGFPSTVFKPDDLFYGNEPAASVSEFPDDPPK